MPRRVRAIAVAALAALAPATWLGGCGDPDGPAAAPGAGVVVHAVDGDTVDVRLAGGVERVRLLGVDTPETVSPQRPVECFGPEASARTKALLAPGTAVRLERDVEARDRYGRLLAHVIRADDGLWVNRALVAEGFAIARDYPPNTTRSGELRAAEAGARRASAGLWGACGGADAVAEPNGSATGPGPHAADRR